MIVQPISFWNGKPTDPLAGLTFLIRAQARGTKIGLWQDTAATVPAAIGNPIAAMTDAYGTGGLTYTQATPLLQPTYVLGSDGKPVIRCTMTTRLDPPAGNIQPVTVFALLQNLGVVDFQTHYVICDNLFLNNNIQLVGSGSLPWTVDFAATTKTIGNSTAGFDLIEAQGTPGASYTAINGAVTSLADVTFNNFGYYIGNSAAGAAGVIADMIALLVLPAAPTAPQRTIILNYLNSLL